MSLTDVVKKKRKDKEKKKERLFKWEQVGVFLWCLKIHLDKF